jgi:uncharacterized protein YkwD
MAVLPLWSSAAQACRGANRGPGALAIEDAKRAVTCLINRQRVRYDLHPLHGAVPLGIAAQSHSQAMVANDFFSHGGDGTPASRAAAAGYMAGRGKFIVGEVLGFGSGYLGSPRAIVRAWMSSPEHRQVLLLRRFRQVGIGVAVGSPTGADAPNMFTYTADLGFHKGR